MWVSLSLLLRLWVAVYLWMMSEYVYFDVSWGVVWYQMVSHSELLDGIVW